MKKVLVWGTGTYAVMFHEWILSHYYVVAYINMDPSFKGDWDGIPIISKDEINNYEYDYIIIASKPETKGHILEDVKSNGIDMAKIKHLFQVLDKEYEIRSVKRQIDIIQEILTADDDKVFDREWMFQQVIRYGVFCFYYDWYNRDRNVCWNYYGMMQIPEEFTDFCIHISSLKIDSAVEIGVYRGKSSYFICALLARKNPDLKYYLVDIDDKLDHFEQYKAVLPQLIKKTGFTSNDFIGQKFDYVFIDADHSYEGSIADYDNVGQYANQIVAFHDIYAHEYDDENGGTVRTWREVLERTQGKEHFIFSLFPEKWMGIGCVCNINPQPSR